MLGGITLLVLLSTGVYMVGMDRLEGKRRGFWDALAWAAETITTTGFGHDAHWDHPAMVLFVVVLQFVGVFLVYLVFPIYLIPFLEERFEARLPVRTPRIADHVLIYRYGPAVEGLLDELTGAGVATVVVEVDRAVARLLVDKGRAVVWSDDEDAGLVAGHLESARALVVNGRDEENASVTLGARQMGYAGEIVALVEEPIHRKPMEMAGASAVYTPRHVLAAALAARASDRISPRVSGLQQLGRHLEVRELRIQAGSTLSGRTLAQSGIGAETGAVVIGQWIDGRLVAPPTPDMRLVARGILVVVGGERSLELLSKLTAGATPLRRRGALVVAGFGEVGRKVHELLRDAGEEVRVIDRRDCPGVDVVGEVLDPSALERAGVGDARTVILALDNDDVTLFATVIVQDLAPDAPVVARVNRSSNLDKIRRAGADFALSVSQVSGQILAQKLLGQDAVSIDPELRLLSVPGAGFAGRHPAELALRERTGCSVIAVERGDEVITQLGPDFAFERDDTVSICGREASMRAFRQEFPS